MVYAIKTRVPDPDADSFTFVAQKTMYGGKRIAQGDTIFVISSENGGGTGLVARGIVAAVDAVPRRPGVERQTPRVTVQVTRIAGAVKRLGRSELKPFTSWDDGRPETELNFKFYRQATDKIAGISDATAAFLAGYFDGEDRESRAASQRRSAEGSDMHHYAVREGNRG